MTTGNTPPDVAGIISRLSQRVDILERRLGRLEAAFEPELPFVQSGPVTVGQSPPFIRRKGGKLVEIVAVLGTAGSTATTVQVLKNGAAVATVTIPAGLDQVHLTTTILAAADTDRFVTAVTAAGTGAVDLTVHFRWDS